MHAGESLRSAVLERRALYFALVRRMEGLQLGDSFQSMGRQYTREVRKHSFCYLLLSSTC